MIKDRKSTLESRIARLEKLLANKKFIKNEGGANGWHNELDGDVADFVTGYVQEVLADESRWEQDERYDGASSSKDFERNFKRLAERRAPEMIDEIMEECAMELDIDEEDMEDYRDMITELAAEEAEGVLETYYEYLPEGLNRRRTCRRCESKISRNRKFGRR